MKVIIALVFLFFGFVPQVFAANIGVVGRVENQTFSTAGSSVVFKDSSSQKVISTAIVDPSGSYSVSIPQGNYDISIVPPPHSGLQQITKRNQHITSDTLSSFTVPSNQTVPTKRGDDNIQYIVGAFIIMLLVSGGMLYVWKKNKK